MFCTRAPQDCHHSNRNEPVGAHAAAGDEIANTSHTATRRGVFLEELGSTVLQRFLSSYCNVVVDGRVAVLVGVGLLVCWFVGLLLFVVVCCCGCCLLLVVVVVFLGTFGWRTIVQNGTVRTVRSVHQQDTNGTTVYRTLLLSTEL